MDVIILLAGILAVSVYYDYRYHRIPNGLSLGGIVIGIAMAAIGNGLIVGSSSALLGGVVGLVLFLPFYVAGKMGAGDVKLLAMSGTFLGPMSVLYAAAFSLMAGAVLAILWMVISLGKESMVNASSDPRLLEAGEAIHEEPSNTASLHKKANSSSALMKSKLPYAAAIAIGTLVSATMQFNG